MSSLRTTVRALPTVLRVGFSEAVAYRAEMLVWVLSTTMPLVMMALWTAVAREAPIGRFGEKEFVAYFLATFIVRQLTGSWAAWQMNFEVKQGILSMRLLRPVHPLAGLFATQAAGVPLRAVVVLPVVVALALSSGASAVATDPAHLGLFALSIAGAWILTFFIFITIGSLSFFLEKSMALAEVYFGLFMVLSGYLVPLALMPGWCRALATWLPFRYMLGAPVEILTGRHDLAAATELVAAQWAWTLAIALLAVTTFRRGLRRYEAFGA